LIRAYFINMGMTPEEAEVLHTHYYREYGLAIRGLIKHHKIDALDFDAKCDASLPLEDMIRPDPKTRNLLKDFDPVVSRLWGLTNAYTDHAERVLNILNLRDLMEGVIYCDYASEHFTCKPEPEYYQQAMQRVQLTDPSKCLFIDDNLANVQGAKALGWGSCVYFWEHKPEDAAPIEGVDAIISDLEELRTIWAFAFKAPPTV